MGLEANSTLRVGRDTFAVKAHLNTDRLEFRGETRLDIPFGTIKSVTAGVNGTLTVVHAGGTAVFGLNDVATAEKWALKIRSPRSLVDKLGLKSGSRVAVLGVDDPDFLAQTTRRLGAAPATKPGRDLDFLFYAADSAAQLARLKSLKAHLQPAGAIWVVSRKGKAATLKDTDVMTAARAAGLVDNKVCGFSATHTALKLVIPRAAR